MGQCTSCLFGSSHDDDSPSPETRRRQQAEAAEARQKSTDARGIKDPEALKKKMQKREEMEKRAEQAGGEQDGGLRWTVG